MGREVSIYIVVETRRVLLIIAFLTSFRLGFLIVRSVLYLESWHILVCTVGIDVDIVSHLRSVYIVTENMLVQAHDMVEQLDDVF